MGKLVYSAHSDSQIAHLPNCQYIRRINLEHRREFDSLAEAVSNGYRLCRYCPSVAQRVRKERTAITQYCNNHSMQFSLENYELNIVSRHDCWKIVTVGKKVKRLKLYHKNTTIRPSKDFLSPYPGFHLQQFSHSKSILGYMEYIAAHDNYIDVHPKPIVVNPEKGVDSSFRVGKTGQYKPIKSKPTSNRNMKRRKNKEKESLYKEQVFFQETHQSRKPRCSKHITLQNLYWEELEY